MAIMSGIRACVFDAYGTLFDVHSAVQRHRSRLGSRADSVSAQWRTKQLEYTWLRSLMGRYTGFDQVTAEALDFVLDANEVNNPELRADLLEAYRVLDCYPEVPTVLAALRSAGMKVAILSNGTSATLETAAESAGLRDSLDQILSVDALAVYKPDPRVYQLAVDSLGVPRESILFHSSNGWDAAGAATFGFRVAWINRSGQPRERLPDAPTVELTSLESVPELVGI
ncbi:MAG: haloacid dehalogenase type II [Aquisalimonadaceae bacterium]